MKTVKKLLDEWGVWVVSEFLWDELKRRGEEADPGSDYDDDENAKADRRGEMDEQRE